MCEIYSSVILDLDLRNYGLIPLTLMDINPSKISFQKDESKLNKTI